MKRSNNLPIKNESIIKIVISVKLPNPISISVSSCVVPFHPITSF
jgi:hypothetical protein